MTTQNFSVVYFVDSCIGHAVEQGARHEAFERFCEVWSARNYARQVIASTEWTETIRRNSPCLVTSKYEIEPIKTLFRCHTVVLLFGKLAISCLLPCSRLPTIHVANEERREKNLFSTSKQSKQSVNTPTNRVCVREERERERKRKRKCAVKVVRDETIFCEEKKTFSINKHNFELETEKT